MIFAKEIKKLEDEIKERKKYCPEESFEQGGKWNYTDILKAKLETLKKASKKVEEIIKSNEKHGIIILDAQVVNDELLSRALNPTHEQEIELIKEDYEIKIKSARIDERNKTCQDLLKQLEEIEL